mmetsp:Transcript_15983/g.43997  ORF Transcript_15983/g.43997 Transcript_15983/m.43997 type:complete len:245 (-) Transcript_15983:36-770(-)
MIKSMFFQLAPLLVAVTINGAEAFSIVAPDAKTNLKNSLSDQKILELAKDYVTNKNGFYAPIDANAHADDFVFRGGVVGPLNKQDYCTTMKKLGIANAFDLSPNPFGFCVDPDTFNTARFYVRYTGEQVKTWEIPGTPISIPPNSAPVVGPTESFCIQFDEVGKVKFLTISAPMLVGNPNPHTTGNYGAVLGLFVHAGLPMAAESAMNSNVRTITNAVADLLPTEARPPKSASKPEDLPSWYQG